MIYWFDCDPTCHRFPQQFRMSHYAREWLAWMEVGHKVIFQLIQCHKDEATSPKRPRPMHAVSCHSTFHLIPSLLIVKFYFIFRRANSIMQICTVAGGAALT